MTNKEKGFSLIELMIVIAIIGILSSVAVPAYTDYIIRSRVTGMLTAIGELKIAITEYRAVRGNITGLNITDGSTLTTTMQNLGVEDPSNLSPHINTIRMTTNGTTDIAFGACGNSSSIGLDGAAELIVIYAGEWVQSGFTWTCMYSGTAGASGNIAKYVPTTCRNAYPGSSSAGTFPSCS